MNRTLYKFCENTSVLIFYSLKAHVSPDHASLLGRGSGGNMALGLRKLFLSDPGGRLRARDEQIGLPGLGLQYDTVHSGLCRL